MDTRFDEQARTLHTCNLNEITGKFYIQEGDGAELQSDEEFDTAVEAWAALRNGELNFSIVD